jgi:rfaE bifunctional protein kinase chain/domain
MVDAYELGDVNRISPEAPVPVLQVRSRHKRLGGAANVVKNLVELGAKVSFASVVGEDGAGRFLLEELDAMGVNREAVWVTPERPTTVKTRVLSQGQQLIRIDDEVSTPLEGAALMAFVDRCLACMASQPLDVIIFEDYDKGVIQPVLIDKIREAAAAKAIPIAVDPKFRNFHAYKGMGLLKPNLKELQEGLGIPIDRQDDASIQRAVDLLMERWEPTCAMVTLSERGVWVHAPALGVVHLHIPAHSREIVDVSGAGDAVIAVAAVLWALGVPLPAVASAANLAGGLVCEKVGVVPIDLETLRSELAGGLLTAPKSATP